MRHDPHSRTCWCHDRYADRRIGREQRLWRCFTDQAICANGGRIVARTGCDLEQVTSHQVQMRLCHGSARHSSSQFTTGASNAGRRIARRGIETEMREARDTSTDGSGQTEFEVVQLFPKVAVRWPALADWCSRASTNVAGIGALTAEWRSRKLAPWLPLTRNVNSLEARCAAYVILASERSLAHCRAAAGAIEQLDPFVAGTLCRAHMENLAHLLRVRGTIEVALNRSPRDIEALDRITREALFSGPDGIPGPNPGGYSIGVGRLVEAARRMLGDHFREDYQLLSALAHPVGLITWSADYDNAERALLTEAVAELLLKVLADGLHVVGHHALAIMDATQGKNIELPDRKPTPEPDDRSSS